ncbi:hypothetical protein PHMEG_00019917 [Phytophthora megakarya]|uniref:Uncharacterized protein n=1 Tax=Phytophthora megakarya TaxID=4795 RepID=A0A225VQF9_9STRA|nr:hypothetical protein PHMEG_00019917 [Phytophthora megakarya]
MTVRSIVEMFESMATSGHADASTHSHESPTRGNVHGLVTYYDALAVVEDPAIIAPTKKTVRIGREEPAVNEQPKDVEREEQEQLQEQEEEEEQEQEEESQPSNQDSSEAPASQPKVMRNCPLLMSKIPPPKSREFHLAAFSVRKPSTEDASRSRTSSSSSNDASQPLYVPPPTPISARIRAPRTSYAAFVSRIENSSSRLLDFEKDERWLGQVETIKVRVEVLKRRNQLALAREIASTPRKIRSMSECSGVSTASTASMSSMDTPEVSCQ